MESKRQGSTNQQPRFKYTICFNSGTEMFFVVGFGREPGHFLLGPRPSGVIYDHAAEAASVVEKIEEFFPLNGTNQCFFVLPVPSSAL